MTVHASRLLLAAVLLSVSGAVLAVPGTPIGGIIVKGGKNPGGQMRSLTTTDANGTFHIRFSEGGEYKLEFDRPSDTQSLVREGVARQVDDAEVDYVVEAGDRIEPRSGRTSGNASRHAPFQNRLENGGMVVTVPKGGGELRGVLQGAPMPAVERAINESGVGVAPTKPKGGVKK